MKYFIALLVLLLLLAQGVFSATIHIPSDRSTISAGIGAAANGDSVLVSPGVYLENISFGGKRIVLQSVAGYATTTIKAVTGDAPVVDMSQGEGSSTMLSGFTIDGNNIAPGIQCLKTSPTIQYCQFQNCRATQDGGGAYLLESGATVRYCVFHNNYSPATGGGLCIARGPANYPCQIYGNEFYDHTTGTAQALGCLTPNNLHIHHNVFHDNLNSGSWSSGGIYMNGGDESVIIYNNTFVRNTHGLVTVDSVYARAYFENNIVVGSTYKGVSSWMQNASYNDVWDNGIRDSFPGNGTISADPDFVNPASDFHLNVTSPCVDAGSPDLGINDSDGTRADLGAFMSLAHTPYVSHISLGAGSPSHVNTLFPTISWQSTVRVGSQVGYEIQIATNSDFSGSVWWGSGQVTSAATSVQYSGPALLRSTYYWLRIRLADPIGWGNWTIVYRFRIDGIPSTPVASAPIGIVTTEFVRLTAQNSIDPDGNPLWYDFEVATDPAFTAIAASRLQVAEQPSETTTDTLFELSQGHTYYWRVRATDSLNHSDYSATATFSIDAVHQSLVHVPLDFPTIQAAIDLHRTGDTILVAPGVYVGAINFRGRGILLRSDSGASVTTIRYKQEYASVITMWGLDSTAVLDGFTIDGEGMSRGILCNNSSPIIQNCEIKNCLTADDGAGIYCANSAPKIRFNKIHDNSCANTGDGVAMNGSMAGRIGEITHNVFYAHKLGSAHGLGCSYAKDLTVRYNVFVDNKNDAAWTGGAIYMNEGGNNIDISNNTFVGNSRVMVLNGSPQPQPRFYNNIVTDCSVVPIDQRLALNGYNNFWHNNGSVLMGSNGVLADPQFVDAAGGDFHLKSTSPCLNQGNPDPSYNDPDSSRADIGAFYRVTSAPGQFALLTPSDSTGYYLYTLTPTMTWQASTDADSGDVITYTVELAYSSNFASLAYHYSTTNLALTASDSLTHQAQYWWRVKASDLQGHSTVCQAPKTFEIWTVGDFDHTHSVNLADLSLLAAYLGGDGQISPKVLGDVTGDCLVNLSDLARLTSFLLGGSVKLTGGSCGGVAVEPEKMKPEVTTTVTAHRLETVPDR